MWNNICMRNKIKILVDYIEGPIRPCFTKCSFAIPFLVVSK